MKQKRDTTYGGNISTEFRLPKAGGRGGKSDTSLAANAQYNNKGSGQVRQYNIKGSGRVRQYNNKGSGRVRTPCCLLFCQPGCGPLWFFGRCVLPLAAICLGILQLRAAGELAGFNGRLV